MTISSTTMTWFPYIQSLRRIRYERYRFNRFEALRLKYKDETMIPPEVFRANLELIDGARDTAGSVVECGVWRGGMIAAIADVLGPERNYYLCDSFEGLQEAKPIDGNSAAEWQKDKSASTYYDNCTAPLDRARATMARSAAKNANFVKGWFNTTLPGLKLPEPIAILRLDGDWYESTMDCFQYLYPQVAPNGLIIIDDYYAWDGCARAVHDYLSRHQLPVRIREKCQGLAYIVKPIQKSDQSGITA